MYPDPDEASRAAFAGGRMTGRHILARRGSHASLPSAHEAHRPLTDFAETAGSICPAVLRHRDTLAASNCTGRANRRRRMRMGKRSVPDPASSDRPANLSVYVLGVLSS